MKSLFDWLDDRTGWRRIAHEALSENIPGGARWRYVWGSTLTFALVAQFVTGMFLWMYYSPSATSAWESVYHIQHVAAGGWFLRGLHHYMAQAMSILLVLHLLQVVIDGAYKAPREVNWWFGVGLLFLTLALSLTGYLLPWDQKGYWATKVSTNLAALTPFVGPEVQRLIVGGADYGHHTLTRFFALHAGVLPAATVALVVGHVALFRRHGITPKRPLRKPDAAFWPDQVLADAVACLAVLATVVFFTVRHHGAELSAPADPSEEYPARPEWYFLFLFQFLKYFSGHTEVWGAIIIPSLLAVVLGAMPLIARWRMGHRFNLVFLGLLLAGAGFLTWQARREDRGNPEFQMAVQRAERDAARAVSLVQQSGGIPPEGAAAMLRQDPLTQGPKLFARNCASCHRFDGHDGLGQARTEEITAATGDTWASLAAARSSSEAQLRAMNPQVGTVAAGTKLSVPELISASDLAGFGSRAWLAGMMDPAQIAGLHFYGGTKFKDGKMVKYVREKVPKYSPAQREQLQQVIQAVSAEAQLPAQAEADLRDAAGIEAGRKALRESLGCTDCHAFRRPDEDATAPDLTGWGSREWLVGMITDPTHDRFYGKRNDRMPKFGRDGVLSPLAVGQLADWLRSAPASQSR